MNTYLAYGRGRLELNLPDHYSVEVVEPAFEPGAADPQQAVLDALNRPIGTDPLKKLLFPGCTAGIVFSDISRATPYDVILPPLMELLRGAGARPVFFNATGTHRINTRDELVSILGEEIVTSCRIVQNDCTDAGSHRLIGNTSRGTEVRILDEFLECDLKILTGFIEPHFFAGFSGGGKAVMPGLAQLAAIQKNHGAAHIDDARSRWGITEGNPIWEDVHEAVDLVPGTFLLNVAMNNAKEVTRVFAGNVRQAHAVGVEHVRRHAMAEVSGRFDIVITSNSGYPLDLNLYQAVKGMSAASGIVREGGDIIAAADCWDGIPDHGSFGKLLREASSPEDLLHSIRTAHRPIQDMWQAQIHARICSMATVHFHTRNLSGEQIREAFMVPSDTIEATVERIVRDKLLEQVRICVLPHGPLTIPYSDSAQRKA